MNGSRTQFVQVGFHTQTLKEIGNGQDISIPKDSNKDSLQTEKHDVTSSYYVCNRDNFQSIWALLIAQSKITFYTTTDYS